MSEIPRGFDANEEPEVEFDLVPPGEYEAVITDSETKETNAGNGSYLKLTFTILGPTHSDRKLWVNLNLENPSEQAVKIARGQLAAICRAVGVLRPKDGSELHDLPMLVRVGIKPAKGDYEAQNKITSWKSKTDTLAIAPTREEPKPPKAAPWKRKK